MTDSPAAEIGPLAEEVAKLLGAAQDWFHRAASASAGTPAECTWCPLCQLIGMIRGAGPEAFERLTEAQSAIAGLLRILAESLAGLVPTPGHDESGDGTSAGADEGAGDPGPRVQRIDLSGSGS